MDQNWAKDMRNLNISFNGYTALDILLMLQPNVWCQLGLLAVLGRSRLVMY